MIYITGDTHGDFKDRFESIARFAKEDDYVIICGDFGLIWDLYESQTEKLNKSFIESFPWTTCFVSGNHECINKASDVLTEKGWMNIEDVYNYPEPLKIATYNRKNKNIYFRYPSKKIRKFSKTIIDIIGKNYKQSVTPNHDVLLKNEKVKAKYLIDKNIKEVDLKHLVVNNNFLGYSENIIKILTFIVMDGTIVDSYGSNSIKIRIQFHLKKQRKIDYLTSLLNAEQIPYTVRPGGLDDFFINIYGQSARRLYELLNYCKKIPKEFSKLSNVEFEWFLDALINTDGYKPGNRIIWRTTDYDNVGVVLEAALYNNYDVRCTKGYYSGYKSDGGLIQYVVSIGKKRIQGYLDIVEREYNDYAYCFSMKEGTLITRYDDAVCITGNCYDRLYELPIVDFHEGKARKISDKIYLLPRGEMFNIEGSKIFTFGGARSHDIWNLLDPNDPEYLEKKESLELTWAFYREIGISWWADEIATEEEFRHGFETLKKYDFKCDYIISHEAPASDCNILKRAGGVMSDYLEAIKRATDFKVWYYGHHHMNLSTGEKMQCLYENFMRIGDIRDDRILGDSVHKKEVFSRRKLEQIIDKAKQEREDVLTGKYQKDINM